MTPERYIYRAFVTGVYDGDSITVDIDLGFGLISQENKLRLVGIDTPELRGGTDASKKAAQDARDYVRSLILNKEIIIKTEKDRTGKYGRYLATVYIPGEEQSLNEKLLSEGYAQPYE